MDADRERVVIADDEQLICTLLTEIIRWDELGLELAGVAHNGRELWQEILDKHPDIVITDICMPELDGIELVRQVREKGIPCRFIIVSGYRLFEYAHNALKYNVEDYILKPIDNTELNTRLNELAQDVRREKKGTEAAIPTDNNGYRRFFLNRVVEDFPEDSPSLEEIRSAYGIDFQPGFFQAVSVALDMPAPREEMIETGTIMDKLAGTLENTLRESCAEVLVDVDGNRIMAGLNYAAGEADNVRRGISEFFDYARDLVNMFVGACVTVGVGGAFDAPRGLKLSKDQAQCAIWARVSLGLGRVIEYAKLERSGAAVSDGARENLFKKIRRSFECWDPQRFSEAAGEIFALIRSRFYAPEARDLCHDIVEAFISTCSEMIAAYSNEDYLRKQIYYGLKCATTVEQMEKAVMEPILSTMHSLIQEFQKQEAKPIRQAIRFMEENYEKPLRLEDAADRVCLCASYFSNLFKKETNENFTDYLTNLRIAKAKEFLQQTELNVAEISCKVGYADARYFSKLFSKVVGIKPTEYRKIYG